jgi:hypothetical protein
MHNPYTLFLKEMFPQGEKKHCYSNNWTKRFFKQASNLQEATTANYYVTFCYTGLRQVQ